jgi:tyrosyl-tRNA synthetase
MLSDETIAANIASIFSIFQQFLNFGDGPTDAVMVDNQDWLGQLGYIELLQEVGTHFTINRMMTFDSVKLRLEREQPMTFLEFNYMILQGYDFRHLSKDMNVRLQMGGSDQWGNIVNGMELGRRMDGADLYGLTTPLLTTAAGAKMGKTAAGAVWLNPEQLSHFDYWQYWRNCDDRDVGKFLKLFTDMPLDEIARLEALEGAEINEAKKILANEATAMCRGGDAARVASDTAAQTFEKGQIGGDLPHATAPVEGISVVDALRELGFAASNKEARRKLDEGAVKVDGEVVRDPQFLILPSINPVPLSLGSKKHGLVTR